MNCISLWQPWASALFAPAFPNVGPRAIKEYETRSWPMPRRLVGQTVAIHAAKRDTRAEQEFWLELVMGEVCREYHGLAFAAIGIQNYRDLPRGCIIGTVIFGRSVRTDDMDPSDAESDWGNFSPGRYAWPVIFSNHFRKPVPCVGRQGFFVWAPDNCGDCDPCIGGRPDQCAVNPLPNLSVSNPQ